MNFKPYRNIWDDTINVDANQIWLDAITDIGVILPDDGEELPDGTWEYVGDYFGGLPVNCNTGDSIKHRAFLAIRRRRNFGRLDHICHVSISNLCYI